METKTEVTNSIEVKSSKTTPFTLANRNGEWAVCVGNQKLHENTFTSEEEAEQFINSKPYELIVNLCCFIMEKYLKNDEN